MEEETKRCQKMVIAMLIQNMKDMVLPYGMMNNRMACRQAFDFIFNQQSEEYDDFCFWCDLANLNQNHWYHLAVMNLANELHIKPWLKYRMMLYLKGRENWLVFRRYYRESKKKGYHNCIEELENEYNN